MRAILRRLIAANQVDTLLMLTLNHLHTTLRKTCSVFGLSLYGTNTQKGISPDALSHGRFVKLRDWLFLLLGFLCPCTGAYFMTPSSPQVQIVHPSQ